VVKKLVKSQKRDVQTLYKEEFGGQGDEIEKLYNDSNYQIFVEVEDKKVVGFVILLMVDELVEIIDIAVKSDSRGKGYGSKMMEEVILFSKSKAKKGVHLEVRESNLSAISLYTKFKFEKIFVRKKYYEGTEDAIIMQLRF